MLIAKIAMSQIMLPAYQGVVSKIPAVVTPSFSCGPSTVSDIDGNIYNTVLIGSQCWMASNLRVSNYNDGASITLNNTYTSGTVSTVWQGLRTGAYTIYDNQASTGTNAMNYGFLYNWYAVKGIFKTEVIASTDTLRICPTGWHVPTDAEWTTLVTYLNTVAPTGSVGGKMKTIGTAYWNSPNTGATNESAFSALPGGSRFLGGSFGNVSHYAFFWSTTEIDVNFARNRHLNKINNVFEMCGPPLNHKSNGASVRCLKD